MQEKISKVAAKKTGIANYKFFLKTFLFSSPIYYP